MWIAKYFKKLFEPKEYYDVVVKGRKNHFRFYESYMIALLKNSDVYENNIIDIDNVKYKIVSVYNNQKLIAVMEISGE